MHFSFTLDPSSLEMSGWWVCGVSLQADKKRHQQCEHRLHIDLVYVKSRVWTCLI